MNIDIVEVAWKLDPNEREEWESLLDGLDPALVSQSVVAFQRTNRRPSPVLFMSHVRAMERKTNRRPDVGPMIEEWKQQYGLRSRRRNGSGRVSR